MIGMSDYAERIRKREIEKFDREILKRKLRKVLQENESIQEVKKKYRLSAEEQEILGELEAEMEEEKRNGQAFLDGWNSGAPTYEK